MNIIRFIILFTIIFVLSCSFTPPVFVGSGNRGDKDGFGIEAEFSYPQGLALDKEGNLYVADTRNNKIKKITPEGEVTTFVENIHEPYSLVFDSKGNLFVTESRKSRILKINSQKEIEVFAGKEDKNTNVGFAGVYGITIDDEDNLYVVDSGLRKVKKVTPNKEIIIYSEEIERPEIIVYNPKTKNLYVIHDSEGILGSNLSIITPDGKLKKLIEKIKNKIEYPSGLAIDKNGYVYFNDLHDSGFYRINPDNNRIQKYTETIRVSVPTNLIIDDTRRILYITSRDNEIHKMKL